MCLSVVHFATGCKSVCIFSGWHFARWCFFLFHVITHHIKLQTSFPPHRFSSGIFPCQGWNPHAASHFQSIPYCLNIDIYLSSVFLCALVVNLPSNPLLFQLTFAPGFTGHLHLVWKTGFSSGTCILSCRLPVQQRKERFMCSCGYL